LRNQIQSHEDVVKVPNGWFAREESIPLMFFAGIFEGGDDGLAEAVRLHMKSYEPAGLGSLHIMYDVVR
jgi:putative SOS response-associated peptidase YedK